MSFEIIDFHTHPFKEEKNNICSHKSVLNMDRNTVLDIAQNLGVTKICGSVIEFGGELKGFEKSKANNQKALELKEYYGDFYIPGFHINPDFVEESLAEMKLMHQKGINLIGELVPYADSWQRKYDSPEFYELLNMAGKYNMIVSFHSQDDDAMDEMVKKHKKVIFVAAHPGEYREFMRHIERMKFSENYYLDISGYGIFRHGALYRLIKEFGEDRILFGSDYPTCNMGMYVGAVLNDNFLTDTQKEKILSLTAKKLLNL